MNFNIPVVSGIQILKMNYGIYETRLEICFPFKEIIWRSEKHFDLYFSILQNAILFKNILTSNLSWKP